MLLAVEVPVETAMRQPEVSQHVRNRRASAAATPKARGGGLNDALARFLGLLGWVSHGRQKMMYIISIAVSNRVAHLRFHRRVRRFQKDSGGCPQPQFTDRTTSASSNPRFSREPRYSVVIG